MGNFEDERHRSSVASLVETIVLDGPENFSYLAKATGMSAETVRYKLSTQLPRRGLIPQISINYENIGLSRKMVTMVFSNRSGVKATKSLEELSGHLYVTYFGKHVGRRIYTLMLAVPPNVWTEYKDFVTALYEQGILESFVAEDVSTYRHIPMRTDLFDFDKGEWKFDWSSVGESRISFPESVHLTPDSCSEKTDYVDLAILSEFQVNATVSISKIARNIRVSEDVAYYHYTEHVKKRGLISQYVMGWVGTGGKYDRGSVSPVLFTLRGVNEKDTAMVRQFFYRFPFSWMELLTNDGVYRVFANVPTNNLNQALHYVGQKTRGLEDNFEISILDPFESIGFPLPLEMFDKKTGWIFNKAHAIKDFTSFFH